MKTAVTDQERLEALLKKLGEAEEKLKYRLSHFRGVPHESAQGELAYSELKVLEDYVEGLNKEVETLKNKMSQNSEGSR
jgi:chaperonin cofactor prefoldin